MMDPGPALRMSGNQTGAIYIRYSPGLYYNLTGGIWYDTRPPRREGKQRYPSPDPREVLGGMPDDV